ncbi:MAG: hypothetical protein HGB31_02860 [Erysipelotrichaceae bacterium]|nr:hypothetical protein [Erysipelotrichaceae bacterium]
MKKLLLGIGLVLSGTVGIVGILIASAIGGSYGSARSTLHISFEFMFVFFLVVFIVGLVYSYKGNKETI